jgi:predicted GIY-YIG superfamily endonuclease
MRYVYIIKGPKYTIYIGITKKDLRLQLEDHRKGNDAVRIDDPFSLIYSFRATSEREAQQKKVLIKALFKAKCLNFKNNEEIIQNDSLYT